MTKDQFKALIQSKSAESFVKDNLFDTECWLFDQPTLIAPDATYQKFRRAISDLLSVNSNEVLLVGSAKFGFSMAPNKHLRPFDARLSDLDCAIISNEIFDQSVASVRRAYFEGYTHLHQAHAGQVFAGHIILSSASTYHSVYLKDVALRLADLQKVASKFLRFEPDVKYRIYESFSVAEAYHIEGVKRLGNKEQA